jgi:hypothetical protein
LFLIFSEIFIYGIQKNLCCQLLAGKVLGPVVLTDSLTLYPLSPPNLWPHLGVEGLIAGGFRLQDGQPMKINAFLNMTTRKYQ